MTELNGAKMIAQTTTPRYTDRTTKTLCGFRPVSHADFFVPVYGRAVHNGQVEKPIYLNKARHHSVVVETCPPSSVWATTKRYGGHMSALTIGSSAIRQIDGLYSLNDLHKASGEEPRHRPNYFLENQQTKDLIAEIQIAGNPAITAKPRVGTYACKELVIAYAAWISPAFHLKVIRVFLAQAGRTLPESISKAQQGELATLIAERFPSGKDRPYAWSRFNNHFRLASYKDLPANRFDEACEYIKTMPDDRPALPKPETRSSVNLFDPDEFMRVREIAGKYLEDVAEKARGGNVTPSLEIPDEVLAGIVAMQMWKNNFTLGFNHEGKATIWKTPDPFDTVARIIADPGWANLEKIRKVFDACMTALTNRLGFGGAK